MTPGGTRAAVTAELRDALGRALLTYEEGVREGRPWADLVVLAAGVGVEEAAGALLRERPGWVVSCTPELGEALLAAGARPVRHAHTMERDLTADPPPPDWSQAGLPTGVRLVPVHERPPEDVYAAHGRAFGPAHPDRRYSTRTSEESRASLRQLLAGQVLGPLLRASSLAVAAAGEVVGGITVHDRAGLPWVGTVFRDPHPAYAGLGAALLRRAVAELAAGGWERVGLAVSHGNPAERVYLRLGFAVTDTSLTVALPGRG